MHVIGPKRLQRGLVEGLVIKPATNGHVDPLAMSKIPTKQQIKCYKDYHKKRNGHTNRLQDIVAYLNSIPKAPPGNSHSVFLFSYYSSDHEMKVGTGHDGDEFHVGFTNLAMLQDLSNAMKLKLRGGFTVMHMDATFKLNYNEFPLVVSCCLLMSVSN